MDDLPDEAVIIEKLEKLRQEKRRIFEQLARPREPEKKTPEPRTTSEGKLDLPPNLRSPEKEERRVAFDRKLERPIFAQQPDRLTERPIDKTRDERSIMRPFDSRPDARHEQRLDARPTDWRGRADGPKPVDDYRGPDREFRPRGAPNYPPYERPYEKRYDYPRSHDRPAPVYDRPYDRPNQPVYRPNAPGYDRTYDRQAPRYSAYPQPRSAGPSPVDTPRVSPIASPQHRGFALPPHQPGGPYSGPQGNYRPHPRPRDDMRPSMPRPPRPTRNPYNR